MSIGDREYVISLTGKDSHKVMIPAGQGSFSIGTKGLSEGKYDVWVEPDSVTIHMATGQGGFIIQAMTQVLLNGLRKGKSSNSNGSLIMVCVSSLQMRILRTCVFMHTGRGRGHFQLTQIANLRFSWEEIYESSPLRAR